MLNPNLNGESFQSSIPNLPISNFDFIIAGGGMAGLSLAYYLSKSSLKDKSILIIDREEKFKNDRTWCFWEIGDNAFEEIIYRKWQTVNFKGIDFDKDLDIGAYQYKMLRSQDFYAFVLAEIKKNAAISFQIATISSIYGTNEQGIVETDKGIFQANFFVFDSTFRPKFDKPDDHNLLQHFKGYVIKTTENVFNPAVPVLMDFEKYEPQDECQFMYLLPIDEKTALIEFTLFSEKILADSDYDFELKNYIKNALQVAHYQVLEEEIGVIPMSDFAFDMYPNPHVMRIGISGGFAKPSTGYTFRKTQKFLQDLVKNLEQTTAYSTIKTLTKKPIIKKRFLFYDSILLNVLQKKRVPAAKVFTELYKKNHASHIFRFLDEESSILEEFWLMNSLPKVKFWFATVDVLWKK